MRIAPSEHARHAPSNDADAAPAAGGRGGGLVDRRRRTIDAMRQPRRAGRLRAEAKTGDQPARRIVLAQEALRAIGRESLADHIGGAGQAQ
jgi:hypothetical protein